MPELPEVEAARRAVEEHCAGRRIIRAVVADDSKVVEGVPPGEFEAALRGKTIVCALRKGKNLWIRLDSPPFPSFQFGMTGAIQIKGVKITKYKRSIVPDEDEWPSKYSKVFLELDDGLEISFTDKRRFARVRLLQNPESMPPISELGPDAFLEPMKLNEFVESLSSKKMSIKGLLLDQSYIAGIGNWIADEVLYQAKIHPLQVAGTLTKDKCEELLKCIKEVVNYAVGVDADCDRFPVEWLFHFRWRKKPGKVNGKKIEFISAGGRTTAYVPELQKLLHTKSVENPLISSVNSSSVVKVSRKRKKEVSERKEVEEPEDISSKTHRAGKDSEDEGTKLKIQRGLSKAKNAVGGTKREKEVSERKEEKESDIVEEERSSKTRRTGKASKEGVILKTQRASLKVKNAEKGTKKEKEASERKDDRISEEGMVVKSQRGRPKTKIAMEGTKVLPTTSKSSRPMVKVSRKRKEEVSERKEGRGSDDTGGEKGIKPKVYQRKRKT